MKLIIKLLIAAAIANAAWRVGSAYLAHYRFKDAVEQLTLYRGERTDDQLRARILELAAQYDVPIDEDQLTIRHDERNHTTVDTSYSRQLELFPGFRYPWAFTIHVETFVAT